MKLTPREIVFYRDKLRDARYSALADAEGFDEICFAVEALGMKLLGEKLNLGKYEDALRKLASESCLYSKLIVSNPAFFSNFTTLFAKLKNARNDVMHTGAFARNATSYAVEFCTLLEDAIVQNNNTHDKLTAAGQYMVKSPVTIEFWQPLAYARQKMLANSFSYLPIKMDDEWKLLSDINIIKFAGGLSNSKKNVVMAKSIGDLVSIGHEGEKLSLTPAIKIDIHESVDLMINDIENQGLWLVMHEEHLVGVLSPFELL
jgi:hypothetical protein